MDASVIVPARDAAETLPGTLDGLSRQAFDGRFEVIVVDNGSLDATARLAERSAIVTQVIRRQRGAGPGAARNAGVAASSWVRAGLSRRRLPSGVLAGSEVVSTR